MQINKSIEILPSKDCCGCAVCADACPQRCIVMEKMQDGFKYPVVDGSICSNCGLCAKKCPILNPVKNLPETTAYAVHAKNITKRNSGSSGGVFGLLAEFVLNEGGKVWGAAFDEKLHLVHTSALHDNDLAPLLKSKYLQSNLEGVYKQIFHDLKTGVYTLFCGTPCQCNALKNFTGANSDKLIVVDFVCHGVPSQDLFDKTIAWYENKYKVKVTSFTFRYKGKGVKHPQSYMCMHKGDDKPHVGLHYQFPYYFGFQKYITLRQSCYSCKWASLSRAGDLTLGDFWGIEKYSSVFNSSEGVSLVVTNTQIGCNIFERLLDTGQLICEEVPVDYAVSNNGCLSSPSKLKKEREEFFHEIQTLPFDQIVKKYLTPRKKWIFDLYYAIPSFFRKIVRRIMDKRMKYE